MSETLTALNSDLPPILTDGSIPFKVGERNFHARKLMNKDALRLLKILETMLMKGGEEFSYHFPGRDPMDPEILGKALGPILLAGIGASDTVLMAFLADVMEIPVIEFEELPLGVFPALINTLSEHPDLKDFFELLRQKGGAMDRLQEWIKKRMQEATKKAEAVKNSLKKP